jgi:DNA-binding CsgD family transcriptional regulator
MLAAQFYADREFSDSTSRHSHTPQRLTARENECLSWTARGKSSWEVAKILQIYEFALS